LPKVGNFRDFHSRKIMKTSPADVAKCKELLKNASNSLQKSTWWYHEEHLCGLLNFRGREGQSPSERLTKILRIAKFNLNVDLQSETISNTYGINGTIYGSYEDFPASYLSENSSRKKRTRYFRKVSQYGNYHQFYGACSESFLLTFCICLLYKGDNVVLITDQINLMKAVIGSSQYANEDVKKRRQNTWKSWYQDSNDAVSRFYENNDICDIIEEFSFIWDDSTDMSIIKNDIRKCLDCLGFKRRDTPRRSSHRFEPSSPATVTRIASASRGPARVTPERTMHESILPNILSLQMIKEMSLDLLAFLEILLFPGFKDTARANDEPSLSDTMVNLRNEVESLGSRRKESVIRSVTLVRNILIDSMPDKLFCPLPNQSLNDWLHDGRAYSASTIPSTRLPPCNYLKSNITNDKPELKTEAASLMRHIIFAHRIPLHNFFDLMQCFSVLLLGRSLTEDEFSSGYTITRHILRLDGIDWHFEMKSCTEYFTTLSQYGFVRYLYSSSDDSEHRKVNRHALAISSIDDNKFACYKILTVMPATGKDGDACADSNLNAFKILIPRRALAHYGGSVTDNASAAVAERRLTFDKVMAYIKDERHPNPTFPLQGDHVFGIKRKIVDLGDGFHIDNLGLTHAINKAYGSVERGSHSQCHHRQAMQSVGDCHGFDPVRSQQAMDHVLEGTNHKVVLTKIKENQLRWLQNGRHSTKLLYMLDLKTVSGNPCLVEYGMRLANTAKNSLQQRIAKEVAIWFSMPTILVAYYFEDELKVYFEITMRWNSAAGELSRSPGFRMLEIQPFFRNFVQPWWNKAKIDPKGTFPKTFKYIEDHVPADKKELKRKQVVAGINAGYNEMLKMHEQSNSCPIVFLLLVDPSCAPNLLRAMLIVIQAHEHDRIFPTVEGWPNLDLYSVDNDDDSINVEQSPESVWIEILNTEQQRILLCHYFHQFGFHIDCIKADLQRMSNAEPTPFLAEEKPLTTFKESYPVLFDALNAVFGTMMSNSRFMEQIHGFLRNDLPLQEAYSITDAKRRYISNVEYLYRRERREDSNKIVAKPGKAKRYRPKSHHNSAPKHNRTKYQIQNLGKQLLHRLKRYSPSSIKLIPVEELKQVQIKKIATDGIMKDNKRLAEDVQLIDEDRIANLRRENLTLVKVLQEANTTEVDNDKTWMEDRDQAIVDNEDDINKFTHVPFWNSGVNVPTLKEEVPKIFPHFQYEWTTWKNRSKFITEFRPYLTELKKLAEDESIRGHGTGNATINLTHLKGKYERLNACMRVDQTKLLSGPREVQRDKMKRTKKAFELSGTTIGFKSGFLPSCDDEVEIVVDLVEAEVMEE